MSPTLSVLLPVYNAQDSLSNLLTTVLEVLADLAPRLEILVIDNGSRDATGEVAAEAACRFPQIRLLRQPDRLGRAAAVRAGLTRTTGQLVLLRDADCQLDPRDLDKLWGGMIGREAAFGRAAQTLRPDGESWTQRFKIWQMALASLPRQAEAPAWQLYRRAVLEALTGQTGNRRELFAELTRRKWSFTEIEMRPLVTVGSTRRIDLRGAIPAPALDAARPNPVRS